MSVTFTVDTAICGGCSPWFEQIVYRELQAAATTGGTTFTLRVEVNGKSLTVEGGNTIWPPEIADAPTFERLPMMERSMRYLRENRDEAGKVREVRNDYVDVQVNSLDDLLRDYEHHGLTLHEIEETMSRARKKVVNAQQGRFDEQKAEQTLDSHLKEQTFSKIVGSGGFTLPAMSNKPNFHDRVEDWLRQLELNFTGWMTSEAEEHFEPYEHKTDY